MEMITDEKRNQSGDVRFTTVCFAMEYFSEKTTVRGVSTVEPRCPRLDPLARRFMAHGWFRSGQETTIREGCRQGRSSSMRLPSSIPNELVRILRC